MTYAEFNSPPPFEAPVWNEARNGTLNAPGAVKWSADFPPPPVGSFVVVTINGCGIAEVRGYFTEGGWLGCKTRLLAPPEWHKRQNKGNPDGHSFGQEMRPLPDFAAALAYKKALELDVTTYGAALRAIPGVGGGAKGLTPDDVKTSREYTSAKAKSDGAFDRLRRFNPWFLKHHGTAYRAHLRASRKEA